MLLSYLKLSLRLLIRNPFFTTINVTGLSVGFAVFFILWQYSESELRSDHQWKDWERIARVGLFGEWTDDGTNWEGAIFGDHFPNIAYEIAADFPEVESFTRIVHQPEFNEKFTGLGSQIVVAVEKPDHTKILFEENKLVCADANVFPFFSIPFISGNPETALINSNSVAMCQSVSRKYFGDAPSLGKTITINNIAFEVTGVYKDFPSNTHLNFTMAISNRAKLDYWNAPPMVGPTTINYIKSVEPIFWSKFEKKINVTKVLKKHFSGQTLGNERMKNLIQPLAEVTFHDWRGDEFTAKSKSMLWVFQLIGLAVLTMGVMNYISLNASRTSKRLKEVATRKMSGASSHDFFIQFMIETFAVFFLAITLGFTLIQTGGGLLQVWLQIPVAESTVSSVGVFIAVALITIALCSSYPAYMSSIHKPRALFLKSTNSKHRTGILSLTSAQYVIAIVLMLCGFIIYHQINFLLMKDTGFTKDNVVVFEPPVLRSKNFENEMETFSSIIKKQGGVTLATLSSNGMGSRNSIAMKRSGDDNLILVDSNGGVDENFAPFFNLSFVAGRNFRSNESANTIILSEGALFRLGFSDAASAIGNRIEVYTDDSYKTTESTEIIGVIKGYRLRPFFKYGDELDKADRGIGLTYKSKLVHYLVPGDISLRVNMTDLEETLSKVKNDFDALFPGNVFNWYFLDEHINQQYQNEKTWRNQILFFSFIAIGIASLGLLGMISNKVIEKTKEIGIRKILGAELHQIAQLLLNTTVKQIAVATLIGIPTAYFLAQQYLEKFSERISLQWWHFALPVVILVVIMLVTIASVLWKAAKSNPVEALKYE